MTDYRKYLEGLPPGAKIFINTDGTTPTTSAPAPQIDAAVAQELLRRKQLQTTRPGVVMPEHQHSPGCGHNHSTPAAAKPVYNPVVTPTRIAPTQRYQQAPQLVGANAVKFALPQVNDTTFTQLVLNNPKPVAVFFTMPKCIACLSLMSAVMPEFHAHYHQDMDIFEFVCGVDTKTDKDHDVSGHPSAVFFYRGEEVGVYLGYSQYEYYKSYIKSNPKIPVNK